MSLEHQSTPDQSTESDELEIGQRSVETTVAFVSFFEGQSLIRTADGVTLRVPGRTNLSEGDTITYLDRAVSISTKVGQTVLRYSFLRAVSTSE